MAKEKTIEICGLSLAANPHPPGVYLEALREASRYQVRARGHDFARITPLVDPIEATIYT